MTDAARWNLQRGIPEDTRYEHTRYNIESDLDAYVLAKVRNRRIILDEANYDKVVNAAGKDIAAAANKELEKLLKNFR